MDRGWWGSRIQNLISHSHVGLPSWEDHIHLKSHARAIWWPHYAFYGKENSQCWSRQGGRAGEGALFIQYLFGPECNSSLSRMVVVLFCFVLLFCVVGLLMGFFWSLFVSLSEAFKWTFKEVSRLCFPACAVWSDLITTPWLSRNRTLLSQPWHILYFLLQWF